MKDKELRELDAWIAEHVMGWEYKLSGSDPYEDGLCWHDENGKFPCELPDYTDPAAALAVLEKCLEETTVMGRRQSDGSHCIWWNDLKDGSHRRVFGDTLPLAICLFAKQLFSKKD